MPETADLVLEGGGVKGIALAGAIGHPVNPRLKNDEVSIARYAHQASTAAQAAAYEAKPTVLGASAAAGETKGRSKPTDQHIRTARKWLLSD
jgi:hypothetical protein